MLLQLERLLKLPTFPFFPSYCSSYSAKEPWVLLSLSRVFPYVSFPPLLRSLLWSILHFSPPLLSPYFLKPVRIESVQQPLLLTLVLLQPSFLLLHRRYLYFLIPLVSFDTFASFPQRSLAPCSRLCRTMPQASAFSYSIYLYEAIPTSEPFLSHLQCYLAVKTFLTIYLKSAPRSLRADLTALSWD